MEPLRATLDSTDGQVATVSRTSSPPPLDILTPPVVAEYWCHTQVRVTKMRYVWTISNFSFCREEMGEVVKSSFFSCGPNDKLKWCLRINPKGLDEESREYLSLYLLLVNCGTKSEARAKFKFSILNAKREETKAMESQRVYRFVQGKDWGFKKFIRRDVLMDEANGLLPNDRLTILCEVSVVGETLSESGQVNNLPIVVPECSIHEDIGSLWLRQILTDVTLVVVANNTEADDKCPTPLAGSAAHGFSRSDMGKKYLHSFDQAREDDAEVEGDEEDEEDEEEDEHGEAVETDEFEEEADEDEENMENESEHEEDSQSLLHYTALTGRSSNLPDELGVAVRQTVVPLDRDEAEAVAAFIPNTNESLVCTTPCTQLANPAKQQQPVSTMSPATTSVPVKGVIIPMGRVGTPSSDTDSAGRVKPPPPPHAVDSVNVSSAAHSSSCADWRLTSSSSSIPPTGLPPAVGDEFRCDSCGKPSTAWIGPSKTTDPRLCRSCCRGSNVTPSTSAVPSTTTTSCSTRPSVTNNNGNLSATDLVGSTSNENASGKMSTRNSRLINHSVSKEQSETGEASTEADASSRVRRSNRRRTSAVNNTSSTTATCGRPSRLRVQRDPTATKSVSTTSSLTVPAQPNSSSCASGSTVSRLKEPVTNTAAVNLNTGVNATNFAPTGNVVLRQFEAHKAILAARSPVFAAMFGHGMEESRANRVEISDMEPDTLAEVLRYIYTGHVVGLDKLAHDLLAAADKYQLERLKTMCEEALVESLTTENCCDILVLADLHNAEQLKAHTLEFIMLHAHDICETDGYEQLVRHRPRLLTECFRNLAAQQLPLRCSARKRPRQS